MCEYRHFKTWIKIPAELAGLSFPAPFFDLLCNCEADKDLKRGAVTVDDGHIAIAYSNHRTGGTVKIKGVSL